MRRRGKIIIPAFLLVIGFSLIGFGGCEKTDVSEDTSTIKGKIVSFVPPCLGNGILISVENIQNFGETGTFFYNTVDSFINYQNAIFVPLFDKYEVEGNDKVTQLTAGSSIEFECRVKTDEDDSLFYSNQVCPAIYMPVTAPRYVITKIINYKNP
jgi:hypothetical protein